jgi:hypothetical protein
MKEANSLAYFDTVAITAVKSFIVRALKAYKKKLFTALVNPARVFVIVSHFNPNLTFLARLQPTPSTGLHFCS